MRHDRDTDERLRRPTLPEPEEAAGRPALPGPSMAALARQPPEARAAVLARLSRSAGNRAVVARIEDTALAGPEIVKGWREESESKLKIDVDSASEPEKLAEIERLLGEVFEPGHGDADTTGWAISKVWKSFGEDMWEKALANRSLFERSMARARDLVWWEDGWGGLRDRFRLAVETRVRDNLAANRSYVRNEMIALGIGEQLEGEEHMQPERDRALRETQVKAEMVAKAEQGMAKARAMKVGETTKWIVTGAGIPVQVTLPEYFDPEEKPDGPGQGEGSQDWAAIKKEYDKLDRIVKQAVAESPALFALHELSKQDMGGFAGLDAAEARTQLRPMLQALIGKIDEAEGLVGDDLDYREMGPIHQQLAGAPGWSGQIEREFIRATITDYNTDKLLRSLGLSLISAIGFLFATFATGGAAVFIGVAAGVGASAVQAGISIEDYYDKAKARAARTGNPELDIMSEEAVDSAFTQAVLDTALAGLDALGGVGAIRKLVSPAVKLLRAGEAGLKASAEVAVKEALHAGDAVSQGAAIERAVAEIGVEGTVRATGKAPAELAAMLPADSAVAKQLLAGADALKTGTKETEALFVRLRDLGSLDPDAAAKAVNEGFERVGYIGTLEAAGGWKAVTKRFGEGHEIVTKLEAWRKQVVQEGLDYVKAASKEQSTAVRTGTESGMSDVDISTFGKDAAQNVERIKEFLARRTNVTRDRLEFLLDADAAVNPTRMHLQDIAPNLSAGMHERILVESTKHQEQLIFARRWHDAREAGDLALMRQLEDVAEQLGIGKFNKGWKPMDAKTLAALEQELDGWAAKLAKLEAAGAPETARRELIEKIGRGQAELLANNPNMYMDVGNIKTLVTRRDIDLVKIERALQQTLGNLDQASLGRLGTVFTHERYLKILGEGPHIDHALQAIRAGGASAPEIANALKAFAKHSERVIATIGSDVAHGVNPWMWKRMHAEFRRIVKAAKEGKLVAETSGELGDLLARVEIQAAELQRGMTTAARALREQAALGKPLTAAESAGISAWAAAEAEARVQTEALIQALRDYHLGVVTGRAGADFLDLLDEDPLTTDGQGSP